MTKYRKKPVVIEAFQWTGDKEKLPDWFIERLKDGTTRIYTEKEEVSYYGEKDLGTVDVVSWVEVETLEGTMRADKGDYIIKGVKGEVYPCKPDVFEQTYEKVEE